MKIPFPNAAALRRLSAGALALSLALAGAATASRADEAGDVQAIKSTLKAMFEKPDNPLVVEPVAVSGDFGVADWTQGPMSGRALLARKGDRWAVALCAGDALRSSEKLRKIGVGAVSALEIANKLSEAEKAVAASRLAQLAGFQGVVAMEAGGLDPKGAE